MWRGHKAPLHHLTYYRHRRPWKGTLWLLQCYCRPTSARFPYTRQVQLCHLCSGKRRKMLIPNPLFLIKVKPMKAEIRLSRNERLTWSKMTKARSVKYFWKIDWTLFKLDLLAVIDPFPPFDVIVFYLPHCVMSLMSYPFKLNYICSRSG